MQDTASSQEGHKKLHREDAPITDWVRKFDDESIRELMEHYRPLLRAIARRHWDRRIQRRVDLSDALQLTWSSMAETTRKIGFKDRSHFAGYLKRTLGNHLVNLRRSLYAKKRSVAREVEPDGDSGDHPSEIAEVQDDVLDQLIEKEFLTETFQALLRLPRELQRLLRWRFRKEMTYAEIAIKIDRKEDDVRRLIDKCLNAVVRELRVNSRTRR